MKDCALLATLSPLIHSILVRSGLFYHTTHHVLELIFYIRILSTIFFSKFFICLKGRKDGRIEENGEQERNVFSFLTNLP